MLLRFERRELGAAAHALGVACIRTVAARTLARLPAAAAALPRDTLQAPLLHAPPGGESAGLIVGPGADDIVRTLDSVIEVHETDG